MEKNRNLSKKIPVPQNNLFIVMYSQGTSDISNLYEIEDKKAGVIMSRPIFKQRQVCIQC